MSVKGYQLRLGLFAAVSALLCVNALAPWGQQTAQWIFTALQATIGVGAIVCGLVVARRMHGLARAWRLVVVAAFVSSLIGDVVWRVGHAASGSYTTPPVSRRVQLHASTADPGDHRPGAAFRPPGDRTRRRSDPEFPRDHRSSMGWCRRYRSRCSCSSPDSATRPVHVLPRSNNTTVMVAYSVLECVVVVSGDGRRHYLSARPLVSQDRGLAVGSEPDRIETLYRSVIRLCDRIGPAGHRGGHRVDRTG